MSVFDTLRPPLPGDPSGAAYKDWLHLNVFLPDGRLALVNLSLHGPDRDIRSRVVGVAMVCDEGGDWLGGIEIAGHAAARIEAQGILLDTVALAVSPDGARLHASVRRAADGLAADLVARPALRLPSLEMTAAFGAGWIGWMAVPVLEVSGSLRLDSAEIVLNGARGYHDHNWGRWFWGEDAAWEWGAFMLPPDLAVVFARGTDKAHRTLGAAHLALVCGQRVIAFTPGQIRVGLERGAMPVRRRLPGALAVIHPDRGMPELPLRLVLEASSSIADLELSFAARSAAQLILAEPTRPGASFINELAGACRLTARLDGRTIRAEGFGVFEYVE